MIKEKRGGKMKGGGAGAKKRWIRGDRLKEELILWNHLEEIQIKASQRHRGGLTAAGDQETSRVYLKALQEFS